MPLAGPLARDRALAHYKHASRYDKEGEPEKSAAHLRRALDYVSFGGLAKRPRSPRRLHEPFPDRLPDSSIVDIANVIPLYDPALRAHPESKGAREYDPDHHEYTPPDTLADAEDATLAAATLLRENAERLKPRLYYKMTNPPIHNDFVHPLVNAWFSDDHGGWINVYEAVDTEATKWSDTSGLTKPGRITYGIAMKALATAEKYVRLANDTYAHCIPFDREFVHGAYCCVVVGARDNKPITVKEVQEKGIWGVECDTYTTNWLLDKELQLRLDWGHERLYVLDIPAYRNAISQNGLGLCTGAPHHPLVNMWVLNIGSLTLTNVYARDTNQLEDFEYLDDKPACDGERKRIATSLITPQHSIPVYLEYAYPFLKRANTQRRPVRILNRPDLAAILEEPKPEQITAPHIFAIWNFLDGNVSPKSGTLEVPHCFVSLQHEFTYKRGHLVTIKPIEPNSVVADPKNPGHTMRPESFSLLGVWAVDDHGRKGVRVFTTEADYLAAYHEQKANQKNARGLNRHGL